MQNYNIVNKSCLHLFKTAKRYSLIDISTICDPRDQFKYRWDIYCEIGKLIMRDILTNRKHEMMKDVFDYIAIDPSKVQNYLLVLRHTKSRNWMTLLVMDPMILLQDVSLGFQIY